MGGQQFLRDGILIDTRLFNKVVDFCPIRGLITVQSGMLWGELVCALKLLNQHHGCTWSIIQKPTGADDISIGGSLASNIHGRVLGRKPFVDDIEYFTAIMSDGSRLEVSRTANPDLFALAIGGYGMFCFVENVTIKLAPTTQLMRKVEMTDASELISKFEEKQNEGASYGDFQFCIDSMAETFLTTGILSTYHSVGLESDTEYSDNVQRYKLSEENWRELLYLAHVDKSKAFSLYCDHYHRTQGQIYSSEDFQLSMYVPDYHNKFTHLCQSGPRNTNGTEMITELYVPTNKLQEFLLSAKRILREQHADVIYGTIRLIEKDDETFLAWAKEKYACIIFNLHINHDQISILRAKNSFRSLIDIALDLGGSYYLTYHRFATKVQLLRAYPQFEKYLAEKKKFDPSGKIRSNWFNQMCLLFESA